MRVMRSDTDGLLVSAQVSCRARVGGRSMPALTKSFARGSATCTWKIGARQVGKTVEGSVQVGYRRAVVSKQFTLKLR